MNKNSLAISNKLNVIKAIISARIRSISSLISNSLNIIQNNVNRQKYNEAFETLPLLFCKYEHEHALKHLLYCIDNIKLDLDAILGSKKCPEKSVQFIAPLCYARNVMTIPELDQFVKVTLAKLWGQKEVSALAVSNEIPCFLVHLKPRNTLTLDEMHVIAHGVEKTMNVNMEWFYERYPITKESSQNLNSIKTMGLVKKALPTDTSVALAPDEIRESKNRNKNNEKTLTDLPLLPIIKEDDYKNMVDYVNKRVKEWNSWQNNQALND